MEGYRVAEWFITYNNIFTILSVVISLAISALAYKVYHITKHWKTGIFSLAFLLIGIGHFFFFTSFLFRFTFDISPHESPLMLAPILLFTLLYIAGAILLLSSTLKVWQWSVPAAIMAMSVVGLALGPRPDMTMHLITFILFVFITAHYLRNYTHHKEKSTFIVLCGFMLLVIGNFTLLFSRHDPLFFSIGRIAQLLGYLAFLGNLWYVLKR